ncbi:hypothetical protein PFISCL1PPCAC_22574, partial [Pristionchus fissidentatus]
SFQVLAMQYTTLLLLAIGVTAAGSVKWTAQNAAGKTCLIFSANSINAKLNILNPDNVTETINFAINETQKVTGECNGKYGGFVANTLEVLFFPDGKLPEHATDGQPWRLFMWFTLNPSATTSFMLADYILETAPGSLFNSTTQNFTKSTSAELEFQATSTNGFKCSTSGLALSDDSTIDLKDTRVIAGAFLDQADFPETQTFEQCQLDSRTSDIVPIVVGACLAGLVVVVLVAYLVGRARAKRQGYASV